MDISETQPVENAFRLIHSSTAFVLLIAAFLRPVAVAAQDKNQGSPSDLLNSIVDSMEKAESQTRLPRHLTREYHLSNVAKIASESEIVAEVDFTPPGRYAIQRRSGSLRSEFVVRNVIQHEMEVTTSVPKARSAALTRENYEFAYLGKGDVDGHSAYLLQLIPRRDQAELIRGRVWVDEQTFRIRRIEGDLAKAPSWWVKSVHLQLEFADFQGIWVQTNMDARAEVRCFGNQELTSRVLNYDRAPLAARNVQIPNPKLAIAITH